MIGDKLVMRDVLYRTVALICFILLSALAAYKFHRSYLVSTSEWLAHSPRLVRINDQLNRDIRACHAYESTANERSYIERRHSWSPSQPTPSTFVDICIVKPKGASNPIRVPTREQARSKPYQVRKDWDSNRKHKRSSVHQQDQQSPDTPSQDSMLMEMLAAPEEADEEQLRRRMRVKTPCNEKIWNRNTIRCFGPFRW